MLTALVTEIRAIFFDSTSADRAGKVEVSGKQVIEFPLVYMLLISRRNFQ